MNDWFFVVKAMMGILSIVLLIWHMNNIWNSNLTKGRRLRYVALLSFAMSVVARSGEQLWNNVTPDLFAIWALCNVSFLVYAIKVSIREENT